MTPGTVLFVTLFENLLIAAKQIQYYLFHVSTLVVLSAAICEYVNGTAPNYSPSMAQLVLSPASCRLMPGIRNTKNNYRALPNEIDNTVSAFAS